MAYDVAHVDGFGGLRIATDKGEVGLQAAVDGVNFELGDDLSYVRSRPGIERLTALLALNEASCYRLIDSPDSSPSAPSLLAVSASASGLGATLDQVDVTTGTVTARGTWTGSNFRFYDAVLFGTPTEASAFIASKDDSLRKYTAGVLTTAPGKPKYVGVVPRSNRLIQGRYEFGPDGPVGSSASKHTVYFSDPSAPTTYVENNKLHLRPGDGQEIRGIVTWREQTYVFKETLMFIFAGETQGAAGEAIFDYRAVNLAGRIGPPTSSRYGPVVAAGAQGVYYLAHDGVYRTTGGPPVRISGAIDDLFRLKTISPHSLSAAGDRIVVHDASGVFIFNERHEQWVKWTLPYPDGYVTPWMARPRNALSDPSGIYYAGNETVLRTAESVTADDGTAFSASYESGFGDLGYPGIKVVRQNELWGTGLVGFSMAVDYGATGASSSLQLGVSPAVASKIERLSRRGTLFSFKVSATSAWRINRLALHVSSRLPIGVRT